MTLTGITTGRPTDDARNLLCQMLRQFYAKDWVSGTGGGMCGLVGDHGLLVAPTGVHKETIQPEELFLVDPADGAVVEAPSAGTSRPSECVGIFCTVLARRGAGAVMHSHALDAVLAADLGDEALVLRGFEMLKGIRGVANSDEHAVPIISNCAREADLVGAVAQVLEDERFARAYAVLVRDHGAYIWGADAWETKKHAEVYHWLFAGARARRS